MYSAVFATSNLGRSAVTIYIKYTRMTGEVTDSLHSPRDSTPIDLAAEWKQSQYVHVAKTQRGGSACRYSEVIITTQHFFLN